MATEALLFCCQSSEFQSFPLGSLMLTVAGLELVFKETANNKERVDKRPWLFSL